MFVVAVSPSEADLTPEDETKSSFRILDGSRHGKGGQDGTAKEPERGTSAAPDPLQNGAPTISPASLCCRAAGT